MEEEANDTDKDKSFLIHLTTFLKRRYFRPLDGLRTPPMLYHYYKEINRFKNKINFIVKKTIRSLNSNLSFNEQEIGELHYFTYRYLLEHASIEQLKAEIHNMKEIVHEKYFFYLEKLPGFSWDVALKKKSSLDQLSIKEAIPTFFIRRLRSVMGLKRIKSEIQFMNSIDNVKSFSISVDELIGNTLNLCFINTLQRGINEGQPIFKKDKQVKNLYEVQSSYKTDVINSELYQKGKMIIMDKASAAVVEVLDPLPGESVLDLCAAPGIKSTLINQRTNRQVNLIVNEFNQDRLNILKRFLRNFPLKSFILNSDGIIPPIRTRFKFDKILVDAPCTGSGTFLTTPELKWRQNHEFLNQNLTLQEKLLDSAIKMLKPGGILVYSTCSLYPEEGELQIQKFQDHLVPQHLPSWISKAFEIEGQQFPGCGRLFPSIHMTQGFFMAKFKKKAE